MKITDELNPHLELTDAQIRKIDRLELKLYKDYHWNLIESESTLKFSLMKGLIKNINNIQLEKLRDLRDKRRLKEKEQKEKRLKESFKIQQNRLKDLKLTNQQLEQIVSSQTKRKDILMQRARALLEQGIDYKLHELSMQIDIEIYSEILNTNQLDQYKELLIEEAQGQKEWRIKHEMDMFRHQYSIELGEKQAKLLIEYQDSIPKKDKDGQYYSEFEQAEFKLQKIKLVLNQDQIRNYEIQHLKQVENIRKDLTRSNLGHYREQFTLVGEYLEYYIRNVLPSKCESRKRIEGVLTDQQKELIQKIRDIYYGKLDEGAELFKAQHYRYNKDLVPNGLLEYQSRDKLNRINPNLCYLYDLQSAKDLMTDSLIKIVKTEYDKLQLVFEKLKKFQIDSYEKNGGTYDGALMKIPIKKGEEHLSYIGLLILEPDLDSNLRKIKMR